MRMNLRIALEGDEEREEVIPFETLVDLGEAEAIDAAFNFEVGPLASAMESQNIWSKRRRSLEAQSISMEEQSAGFWALVATAVVAAMALLFKMMGWLTGEGSGGGGGGASGSVQKKLGPAAAKAEIGKEHARVILKYAS